MCSSYLIIFGISALNYNHKFASVELGTEKGVWEQSVTVERIEDDWNFSLAIRDSLGLIGWPGLRDAYREDNGNFHFGLYRPGKQYTIHVLTEQHLVKVEEQRSGYWAVIGSLHGLREVPASRFMSFWGIYTEIVTWVMLFSVVSGVYLWTARRSERIIGWILLESIAGGSLVFMLYIWLRG